MGTLKICTKSKFLTISWILTLLVQKTKTLFSEEWMRIINFTCKLWMLSFQMKILISIYVSFLKIMFQNMILLSFFKTGTIEFYWHSETKVTPLCAPTAVIKSWKLSYILSLYNNECVDSKKLRSSQELTYTSLPPPSNAFRFKTYKKHHMYIIRDNLCIFLPTNQLLYEQKKNRTKLIKGAILWKACDGAFIIQWKITLHYNIHWRKVNYSFHFILFAWFFQ